MAWVLATHPISCSRRRLCAPPARGCSVGSEKGWVPAATISAPPARANAPTSRRNAGNSLASPATFPKTGETISTQDRESSEVTRFVPSPAEITSSTAGTRAREAGSTSWNSSSTPTVHGGPAPNAASMGLL